MFFCSSEFLLSYNILNFFWCLFSYFWFLCPRKHLFLNNWYSYYLLWMSWNGYILLGFLPFPVEEPILVIGSSNIYMSVERLYYMIGNPSSIILILIGCSYIIFNLASSCLPSSLIEMLSSTAYASSSWTSYIACTFYSQTSSTTGYSSTTWGLCINSSQVYFQWETS
jgi:hypothetical protein